MYKLTHTSMFLCKSVYAWSPIYPPLLPLKLLMWQINKVNVWKKHTAPFKITELIFENNNFSRKTAIQIFPRPTSKYLLYYFSYTIHNIRPLEMTLKGLS